ncbi:MAG: DsbA family protein [Candidatus Saccharimonadales bacterium]
MNKQFFGIIIVVVLALVGVFALTSKDVGQQAGGGGDKAATTSNHIAGKADSKVTLIEYGDFQCPACKSYFPLVTELKNTYGDRVAFQFRHYPLVQIHPNAFISSRAAEAAGKQDKFFEMHDLLYENQDNWANLTVANANTLFESYAQELQLDVEKFKTDMNSAAVADTINADARAAQAAGGNSTPTFVLNGSKIDKNPQSLDEFKKLLDDELAKN